MCDHIPGRISLSVSISDLLFNHTVFFRQQRRRVLAQVRPAFTSLITASSRPRPGDSGRTRISVAASLIFPQCCTTAASPIINKTFDTCQSRAIDGPRRVTPAGFRVSVKHCAVCSLPPTRCQGSINRFVLGLVFFAEKCFQNSSFVIVYLSQISLADNSLLGED